MCAGSAVEVPTDRWPPPDDSTSHLENGASVFPQESSPAAATSDAAAPPFLRLRLASRAAQSLAAERDIPSMDANVALSSASERSGGANLGQGSEQGQREQGAGDAHGGSPPADDSEDGEANPDGKPGGAQGEEAALSVWVEPVVLALHPACLIRLGGLLDRLPGGEQEALGTLNLQSANRLASRGARTAAKARLVLHGARSLALDVQVRVCLGIGSLPGMFFKSCFLQGFVIK